ncbi:MAG: NlpC/P60 family protein [Flavobacteriales bacterium]|nr:NlpC/P60 family protein [Flavobacteriales bacterium]
MNLLKNISFLFNNRILLIFFLNSFLIYFFSACTSKKQVLKKDISTHKVNKQFLETYSARLGIALKPDCNKKLIETVSSWLNTPYKYGGNTKQGTDCSGFVQQVYAEVYGVSLARSAADIFVQCNKIQRSDLKEGDLVFFKINTPKVSHVGIYLTDEYFIHASTKKGVIVNSLTEEYYAKYFFSAGRIP